MHPNPVFRTASEEANLRFARDRGFGQLSIAAEGRPLVAHIPFVLDADGRFADLHLLRSNPIVRAATAPCPALLTISGPDSYISPDWYETESQVPTWNYVAVHLIGQLVPLPQSELRASLDRLTEAFEKRLDPKAPWTAEKMPPEMLGRMMRTIRPFRLDLTAVDGTWKLGQNKPAPARQEAAIRLEEAGIGQEVSTLAELMRSSDD